MKSKLTKDKIIKFIEIVLCIAVVMVCALTPTNKIKPNIKFHYNDTSIQGTAQIFWVVGDEGFNETESIKREISNGQISFNIPDTITGLRIDFINNLNPFDISGVSFCYNDKVDKMFSGQELLDCFDEHYGISDMIVDGDIVKIIPSNEDPYIYVTEEFIEAYNDSYKSVLTLYNLLYAAIAAVVSLLLLNSKKIIRDFAESFKAIKLSYKENGVNTKQGMLTAILLVLGVITIILCLVSFVQFKGTDGAVSYADVWKIILIFVVSLIVVNLIPSLPKEYHRIFSLVVVIMPYFNYQLVENIIDGTLPEDKAIIKIGLFIVYAIYVFFCGIFSNISIGYAISTAVMIIFGLANYFVIAFRGRAIIVTDIYAARTAAGVAGAYEYNMGSDAFVCLLMLVCSCVVMFALSFPKLKLPLCFVRVAVTTVLAVTLFKNVNYNIEHNGITMNYWTIDKSFEEKGYILGFYISIGDMTIERPEGYSVELLESYVVDEPEVELSNQPTNLIIVMNESWSDLSDLGELETTNPYMDYYNSMSGDNVVKGRLHVPVYSSGTSCSEYEVLTGNAIHFLPQGLSPYEAYSSQNEYSLATTAKAQGYKTIAMHPENPRNWNRNNVYPCMGFDEFYSINDYEGYGRVRNYVGDKGDFEKIINYLETKETGEKTFIFNVTMQNHGGYTGTYDGFDVDVIVTNTSQNYERVNNYLSLIKLTDESIEYFLEYLETFDENTMVVMFGDHFPGVEEKFYSEIMKVDDGISWEESEKRYATPYFIWTNYDADLEQIGDISANYLGSYVMKMANLKTTEYNNFLLEMSKELPVLGIFGVYNSEGEYCTYDDPRYQEQINKYWYIQYNYIFDKQNRVDSIFTID